MKKGKVDFESGIDTTGIGYKIDLLIRSDLENWKGKETFFDPKSSAVKANKSIIISFQANKIRNKMITEINRIIHNGPEFHFRNYHNY